MIIGEYELIFDPTIVVINQPGVGSIRATYSDIEAIYAAIASRSSDSGTAGAGCTDASGISEHEVSGTSRVIDPYLS